MAPEATPNLGIARAEYLGGELRRDDLDLLDRLEAHLVFVAGIAERGARTEAGGERRLGLRVHHIGRGIEVDAVLLMDTAVLGDQLRDCGLDLCPGIGRARRDPLDIILDRLGTQDRRISAVMSVLLDVKRLTARIITLKLSVGGGVVIRELLECPCDE